MLGKESRDGGIKAVGKTREHEEFNTEATENTEDTEKTARSFTEERKGRKGDKKHPLCVWRSRLSAAEHGGNCHDTDQG
jgi:hypothetical protein